VTLNLTLTEIITISFEGGLSWYVYDAAQVIPSKLKTPLLSLFYFFIALFDPRKRRVNVLPHTFRPVASPLHLPPPHRWHRFFGLTVLNYCCRRHCICWKAHWMDSIWSLRLMMTYVLWILLLSYQDDNILFSYWNWNFQSFDFKSSLSGIFFQSGIKWFGLVTLNLILTEIITISFAGGLSCYVYDAAQVIPLKLKTPPLSLFLFFRRSIRPP
jgi:hypothetical protein